MTTPVEAVAQAIAKREADSMGTRCYEPSQMNHDDAVVAIEELRANVDEMGIQNLLVSVRLGALPIGHIADRIVGEILGEKQ